MEDKVFDQIVELKVADIVAMVIEIKQLGFEDSIEYLYSSKLYNRLVIEETKLWYLSPAKLFEMLDNEKLTGVLKFPE